MPCSDHACNANSTYALQVTEQSCTLGRQQQQQKVMTHSMIYGVTDQYIAAAGSLHPTIPPGYASLSKTHSQGLWRAGRDILSTWHCLTAKHVLKKLRQSYSKPIIRLHDRPPHASVITQSTPSCRAYLPASIMFVCKNIFFAYISVQHTHTMYASKCLHNT